MRAFRALLHEKPVSLSRQRPVVVPDDNQQTPAAAERSTKEKVAGRDFERPAPMLNRATHS